MTTTSPKVMTVDEMREIVFSGKLGRAAAYNAIARGDIPGVIRIGRRILISRAAIEKMISGETTPAAR